MPLNRSQSFPSLNALTPLYNISNSSFTLHELNKFEETNTESHISEFNLHGPKRRVRSIKRKTRSIPSTPSTPFPLPLRDSISNIPDDSQITFDWIQQLSASLKFHRREQQGMAYFVSGSDKYDEDPRILMKRRESSMDLILQSNQITLDQDIQDFQDNLDENFNISSIYFSDSEEEQDENEDPPSLEDHTISLQDPHGVYAWMERLFEFPLTLASNSLHVIYHTLKPMDDIIPIQKYDKSTNDLTRLYKLRQSYSEKMQKYHKNLNQNQIQNGTDVSDDDLDFENSMNIFPIETDELIEGVIRAMAVLGRVF